MSEAEKKHNIRWFEKLRLNSWEVEILIVGFVLVLLFNIPDILSLELSKTVYSVSLEEQADYLIWLIRLIALGILHSIVNILIVSFSIYLALRGFWVGVLGLSSVYPDGINLKKLNFNIIFHKRIEKYNFNDFVIKIDHICSSIFSFSFLVSFSIVSLCLFFIEFVVLATYLHTINDSNQFQSVILIPFGGLGCVFFIDYFFFGIIKKIKWKIFGYIFNGIDKFYKYITFIFIYDTLYYAFISNIKRRVVFLLFISMIFLFSSFESLELKKHTYFPNITSSKNMMHYRNYEDRFKKKDYYDSNLYPNHAFIQSDVITQNYLKLHIPYHVNMNKPIEHLCPEVLGGLLESDNTKTNSTDKEAEILNCINNSYTIFINENQIENDFIFYEYPHPLLDIKSFFMLIPLDFYASGRHVLRIEKRMKSHLKSMSFNNGVFKQEFSSGPDSVVHIPFYLSK